MAIFSIMNLVPMRISNASRKKAVRISKRMSFINTISPRKKKSAECIRNTPKESDIRLSMSRKVKYTTLNITQFTIFLKVCNINKDLNT